MAYETNLCFHTVLLFCSFYFFKDLYVEDLGALLLASVPEQADFFFLREITLKIRLRHYMIFTRVVNAKSTVKFCNLNKSALLNWF